MNRSGSPSTSLDGWGPVPLGEVLGAVMALKRREFRRGFVPSAVPGAVSVWRPAPGEAPVLVMGCSGSAGASTVALLLAQNASRARVVECAPGPCSGLAGAATAELGETSGGWEEGSRSEVRLQRRRDQMLSPDAVPVPAPGQPGQLTVVDSWWDLRQMLAGHGWLAELARSCPRVVLVARTTVPGMRQLEGCLALLEAERCWAVATGATAHRWPRTVERSLGRSTRQLREAGRLVCLPKDPVLSVAGITTEPLPRSFDHTASLLLKGLFP